MTYIASHGITIKCAMFLFALHALSKFEGDMHAQYGNMSCKVFKKEHKNKYILGQKYIHLINI